MLKGTWNVFCQQPNCEVNEPKDLDFLPSGRHLNYAMHSLQQEEWNEIRDVLGLGLPAKCTLPARKMFTWGIGRVCVAYHSVFLLK